MKLFDPGSQDQRCSVLPVLAFLMRDLWALLVHRWLLSMGLSSFHTVFLRAFSHCWIDTKYFTWAS